MLVMLVVLVDVGGSAPTLCPQRLVQTILLIAALWVPLRWTEAAWSPPVSMMGAFGSVFCQFSLKKLRLRPGEMCPEALAGRV